MAIISSLLLLMAAQVSAEPIPTEIHNFGDWVVACDNGNRCEAVSLVPEPTPAEQEAASMQAGQPATPGAPAAQDPWERYGVLRFERDAGPDAPLVMLLSDFEGTPARLTVYDNALEARIRRAGEGEGEWWIEPANLKDFVSSLYADAPLLVQDAAGRTLSHIALDGATNALIYMEERQGRLRTRGAVARPGPRPNSVVPAAPALPVVRGTPPTRERPLAIPAARMAEARRAARCTVEDVGMNADEASTSALGGGKTLIMMNCGSGAYNATSLPLIAWREDRTIRIEAAPFDVSQDWGDEPPTRAGYSVTNAEYDEASMTISSWAKGRGIGDCGVRSDFVWDGERFRLTLQQEMSVCQGTLEMLSTWRAEVRR
jgi:hypothetical protein